MKNIALICNPTPEAVTRALPLAEQIAYCLNQKGISYSLVTTQWPAHWDGFSALWIIGGDGTLNQFINQYPENQIPLVIFKGGSGNDFHWALYGDITVEQQIEQVLRGNVQWVDAGTCNGRWFLNGVGIGFDGAIVHDLLGKKKAAGKASYLLSVLKNIVSYTEKSCVIVMDTAIISQECFMISVANGRRYGGGFEVAPKASLTDGLLDVNIVGRIAPLRRLKYLPVIEKGEHLNLPFNQYHFSKKISITSHQTLHAHLDGEYLASNKFEIELAANRIAFVV